MIRIKYDDRDASCDGIVEIDETLTARETILKLIEVSRIPYSDQRSDEEAPPCRFTFVAELSESMVDERVDFYMRFESDYD
jgi:hypothetical protein